jgi:hypothetical protein
MRQDNASGHDIEPIERRKASSGLVDYSSPIVLYESSKSKIALIPYNG